MNPKKFSLFIVICLLVLFGAAWLVWGNATMNKTGEIVVESGEGAVIVWSKMVDEGFTARMLPWRFRAWRMRAAENLKAGAYHIERGETISQVIERLTSGDVVPDELAITFPEGFTLEQMAARTGAKGLGTPEEFISSATPANFQDRYPFLKTVPPSRDLEGYLFPDTYKVFDDDSPRDVISRQLANFDQKVTEELRQEAAAAGRSLDDIVIMASIIEREVLTDADMALVAGVLWKRVDAGAGMDADATVRYALKKWDEPLTVADLQVNSPYNTRRFRGLPPGPISNPGLRALVAAVRPEASDYYYYLSAPDGRTYFAETNDEQNRNKAKYLN